MKDKNKKIKKNSDYDSGWKESIEEYLPHLLTLTLFRTYKTELFEIKTVKKKPVIY